MSLMNGLSSAGAGLSGFAANYAAEQQKADAAAALQQSGGVIQGNLLQQRAALEQQQAVLADNLARASKSAELTQSGGIAATAASTLAGTQAAARQQEAELQANAPTPEIRSARQFATLSPAEKQAYREEMMTKAGLPAWMIGGSDSPSPPTGSAAVSDMPTTASDNGTISPVSPAASSPVTGTAPDPGAANRNDAALNNVPGAAASIVKGMVDGRIAPPSSFALSKPYWQGLISKAAEYDPTFDQTTWAGRVATRKDFASGKSAVAVTAMNTALSHAGTLIADFDNLGNTPVPAVNYVLNNVGQALGGASLTKAEETRDALASEARKVFAASGGGNLTELQEWQKNFPLNGSPVQQKAALTGFVELLDGRLQSLADQYNRGMGRTDDPINLLQPKARAVYEKLTGREPTNATGYQTGKPPEGTSNAASTQDAEAGTIAASKAPAADPLSMARDAITRGAPRDAVIQRLRDNGINPGGL